MAHERAVARSGSAVGEMTPSSGSGTAVGVTTVVAVIMLPATQVVGESHFVSGSQ
jgi:hypothetical protein